MRIGVTALCAPDPGECVEGLKRARARAKRSSRREQVCGSSESHFLESRGWNRCEFLFFVFWGEKGGRLFIVVRESRKTPPHAKIADVAGGGGERSRATELPRSTQTRRLFVCLFVCLCAQLFCPRVPEQEKKTTPRPGSAPSCERRRLLCDDVTKDEARTSQRVGRECCLSARNPPMILESRRQAGAVGSALALAPRAEALQIKESGTPRIFF